MNPGDMTQAAQSNDVLGALQKLLVSRIPTPEQEADQRANRGRTMQEYQQELMTPSLPSHAPASMMLADMAASFRPGVHPMYAAGKGAKSGMDLQLKMDAADQAGRIAAAKVGFDEAKDIDKLGVLELSALRGALGGRGAGAGSFIQFKDDAGNLYIMNKATGQREIIPATHTKLWSEAYSQGYKNAVEQGMPNPEDYAASFANETLSKVPGARITVDTNQKPTRPMGEAGPVSPGVTPVTGLSGVAEAPNAGAGGFPAAAKSGAENDRMFILQQEYAAEGAIVEQLKNNPADPRYAAALRNQALIREEMKRVGGAGAGGGGAATPAIPTGGTGQGAAGLNAGQGAATPYTPPQKPATGPQNSGATLSYKNVPAEKGSISGNEEMGKAYVRDYDAVREQAASADAQYENFNAMAKIDPKTSLFNKPMAAIGSFLGALGVDPNSPSVKAAIERREVEQLMSALSNAFLRGEKGVQTKSDEDRIARELPQLSDTKQAWDMMIKVGIERAKRKKEMLAFYDNIAEANNGVPVRARQQWEKEYRNDPLTTMYGGKLLTRSEYIKMFLNANPNATEADAIADWREIEREYQNRRRK